MKKLFLSLLLCVLSAITYGQTFFVKVFDKNSKLPIEKAHLKLGAKVYLTNSEGLAIITPLKTTRLEITHLQYQKQTIYLKGKRRKEIFLLEKQSILDEMKAEQIVMAENDKLFRNQLNQNSSELKGLSFLEKKFGTKLNDSKQDII